VETGESSHKQKLPEMGKQFQSVLKIKAIKTSMNTFAQGHAMPKKLSSGTVMCAHVHNHKLFQAYKSNP
jgi:hypothetical protein